MEKECPNICFIIIGMSGTGKTTLANSLSDGNGVHMINLDPAVKVLPYKPLMDISD